MVRRLFHHTIWREEHKDTALDEFRALDDRLPQICQHGQVASVGVVKVELGTASNVLLDDLDFNLFLIDYVIVD